MKAKIEVKDGDIATLRQILFEIAMDWVKNGFEPDIKYEE